jgi:hypothetical protein
MSSELRRVKAKFAELIHSPLHTFPRSRARFTETDKRGVYVIYSPCGKVLHVGNHLHGQSSSPTSLSSSKNMGVAA